MLPCEIRLSEREKELEVCVRLKGVRGSQRVVKTGRREGCRTSGGKEQSSVSWRREQGAMQYE